MRKIDSIIPLRSLCICVFITLLATSILHAKTNVFFSPRGLIRDTIIKTINSSEKSIDVAVLIFTAGEIAEALYEAKERGVKIRIIIDQRQQKKRYPVLEFLKEEGFDLQFLKGNVGGFMNHTFAIFDAKLLVTGSYNWTEYAEKFNYENAIFIDEPDVVKRFQEEFESLYNKSVAKKAGRLAESELDAPLSKVEAVTELDKKEVLSGFDDVRIIKVKREEEPVRKDKITTPITEKIVQEKETGIEKEQVKTAKESLKDFLDISFNDFDNTFGKKSKLKAAEKKRIWKDKYEGKYVRWTGRIIRKGIAVYDWNRMVVDQEDADTDVQLKFDWTKRKTVMRLNVGDVITYTGRLVSLQGFSSLYKLDYADVLKTE
ncbi:MAG: phospholipase D-like domain-containing protein [Candidatus Scalinduaceae bacterium]